MAGRRLRLITFDAMNTIIRLKEPVGVIYGRFANTENNLNNIWGNISDDVIKTSFRRNFEKYSLSSPCFGYSSATPSTISNKKWWTDCVKSTLNDAYNKTNKELLPSSKLDTVAEKLYEYYKTTDPWILEPSIKSTLAYLKTKGIALGILSNYDTRLREILRNFEIAHYFDVFVLSGELGVEKPNIKIFKFMENVFKIDGEEILHIGDDLKKDYFAAKNAGWNGVLYDQNKTYINDTNIDIPHEDIMNSLSDLRNKIT